MTDCLKQPALLVGDIDEDINLSVPPTSGEEYIKRVVVEASQCADIVVADIDLSRFHKQTVGVETLSGCVEAPPTLRPSLSWQQCQVSDFSNIRLYISQLKHEIQTLQRKWRPSENGLPHIQDKMGWKRFCSDSKKVAEIAPTLNVIFSLNQPTVEQALDYMTEQVEKEGKIESHLGKWIYALLVVLEIPLSPDAYACLRTLARTCSIIRANNTNLDGPAIGALNLFICLVARYFRQLDLADP